jgi:hypothetical protein
MENMMNTVKLTEAQAAYLANPRNGSPRGLVRKGCLAYRWGTNPSYGYVVTALGKRSLEAYKRL